MRDPKRIDKFESTLTKLYQQRYNKEETFPDFLARIISSLVSDYNIFDIFFPEDSDWLNWISLIEKRKEPSSNSKTISDSLIYFFKAWRCVPDWRFGQFISNTFCFGGEDKFIENYKTFIENHK